MGMLFAKSRQRLLGEGVERAIAGAKRRRGMRAFLLGEQGGFGLGKRCGRGRVGDILGGDVSIHTTHTNDGGIWLWLARRFGGWLCLC